MKEDIELMRKFIKEGIPPESMALHSYLKSLREVPMDDALLELHARHEEHPEIMHGVVVCWLSVQLMCITEADYDDIHNILNDLKSHVIQFEKTMTNVSHEKEE